MSLQRLALSLNNMVNDKRFQGLTDQADFYLNLKHDRGFLSEQQKDHLREIRDTLFSEYGASASEWLTEINDAL